METDTELEPDELEPDELEPDELEPDESGTDALLVPMPKAMMVIGFVIVANLFFFFVPWQMTWKMNLFMGVCILFALLLNDYTSSLNEGEKIELNETVNARTGHKLQSFYIYGLILWCGVVMFSQYWVAGGREPFFHDLIITYVIGLIPLLCTWLIQALTSIKLDEDGQFETFYAIIRVYKLWAWGFLGMYGIILFMLMIFEGD